MDSYCQFSKLLVQQDKKMIRKLLFTILLGILIIVNGCNTFLGDMEGAVTPNQPPTVEFTNVPAVGDTFSYAPVIYWKGSDPDGFVELYAYADITDSAAILNPEYYLEVIPIRINFWEVLGVSMFALFFSIVFTFFQAWKAGRTRPLEIIRKH